MKTRPAPPIANWPRCPACQGCARPSTAEYWHIGETTTRLGRTRERSVSGANRGDMCTSSGKKAPREQGLHVASTVRDQVDEYRSIDDAVDDQIGLECYLTEVPDADGGKRRRIGAPQRETGEVATEFLQLVEHMAGTGSRVGVRDVIVDLFEVTFRA